MYHVHGHLDELICYEDMNCDCDKLAGSALHHALAAGTFISRHLPDKDLAVLLDGEKVTGSYEKTITRCWGDKQARLHYHEMGIIPLDLFDEVYWDGVEKVLGRCPEMFSVWAAKQVSGFCGNNHLLHHINGLRWMYVQTVAVIQSVPLTSSSAETQLAPPSSTPPSIGSSSG
jgi:hypothetical protein